MAYRIAGLDPTGFSNTDALITAETIPMAATIQPGFPRRVSLLFPGPRGAIR